VISQGRTFRGQIDCQCKRMELCYELRFTRWVSLVLDIALGSEPSTSAIAGDDRLAGAPFCAT